MDNVCKSSARCRQNIIFGLGQTFLLVVLLCLCVDLSAHDVMAMCPGCNYAHRRKPKEDPPPAPPPKEQPKTTPAEKPKEQPKEPPKDQPPDQPKPQSQPTPAPADQPPADTTPPEKPSDSSPAPSTGSEKPSDSSTPSSTGTDKPSDSATTPSAGMDKSSAPPTDQSKPADSGTKPPPPPGGSNIGNAGAGAKAKSPSGPSILRPPLGIGIQPSIYDLTMGNTTNLLGVVEPWEVWWDRNRIKYLKFRQPIQFFQKTDDGYTKVLKEYNETANLFMKALKDQDDGVVVVAALGLSKLGDTKFSESISKVFYGQDRDYLENNMILSLGMLGTPQDISLLRTICIHKDEKELDRCYALLGLGYIANKPAVVKTLTEVLNNGPDKPEVLACAALALGNLQERAATGLLGKLLNAGTVFQGEKQERRVRCYAALALGRLGTKEAMDELKKSVEDKDRDVRACIAIALGMTKMSEAVAPLSLLIKDHDISVRGFSAIALGQIQDKSSLDLLNSAAQINKDPQVEGMIILAMGLTGNQKAAGDLQKILTSRSKRPLIKGAAAIALGLLKDKSAAPLVADLLEDKKADPVLASYLITSLGMLGDEKSVAVLRKMWEKINGKYITDVAYTNLAVALTMLGQRDEIVLPQIRKNLDKREMAVLREHALHSAGLVGNKSLIPDFISAYQNENDAQVRKYAVSGLGFLADCNEMPQIIKYTADNDYNVYLHIMDYLLPLPLW